MPKDVPEYRKALAQKDFVTNIPIKPPQFKSALARAFGIANLPQPLTQQEYSLLKGTV